jgi:hypothetical protein
METVSGQKPLFTRTFYPEGSDYDFAAAAGLLTLLRSCGLPVL